MVILMIIRFNFKRKGTFSVNGLNVKYFVFKIQFLIYFVGHKEFFLTTKSYVYYSGLAWSFIAFCFRSCGDLVLRAKQYRTIAKDS